MENCKSSFIANLFEGFPQSQSLQVDASCILDELKKTQQIVCQLGEHIDRYEQEMDTKFQCLEGQFQQLNEMQQTEVKELISAWEDYGNQLVQYIIPQLITFGLDNNGRMVAYIPKNWQNIRFMTNTSNVQSPDYGRLQVEFN